MKWKDPMNSERWQLLKEIFEAVYDKSDSERAAYLDHACRADPGLRREVETLLAYQSPDSLLDKPAYEAIPELFESETDDAIVGKQLGSYAVTRKIGRGGMGVVYLARDTNLDRPVAIKMLAPGFTSDEKQRERLKIEARAAARLSHPGIATVYSLEEFGNNVCIISEYVPGLTLDQIMSGKPLPFPTVLDIALQITRALAAAHDRGIVHRDLKPENIIRNESGITKILDFGLARVELQNARLASPRLTRAGTFLGTPAYASPEQLLGADVDRNTDIFSLGIIMYELAAGRHPFGAKDTMSTVARILGAEIPDISLQNPDIPKEFDRVIRHCLRKKPSDRYPRTRDLLTELESLSKKRPVLPEASSSALWWWQFHQACAGFGYYGMLYPLWRVKEWLGGIEGSLLFFPALIAVGVSANLRFHLWFISRFFLPELEAQRRKVTVWIRWADWLFVLMLAINAIRIHTLHAIIATLLMAVAVGGLIAFSLIEPATERAALDKR
jgi:predicted Ser/Thr protein kinase